MFPPTLSHLGVHPRAVDAKRAETTPMVAKGVAGAYGVWFQLPARRNNQYKEPLADGLPVSG